MSSSQHEQQTTTTTTTTHPYSVCPCCLNCIMRPVQRAQFALDCFGLLQCCMLITWTKHEPLPIGPAKECVSTSDRRECGGKQPIQKQTTREQRTVIDSATITPHAQTAPTGHICLFRPSFARLLGAVVPCFGEKQIVENKWAVLSE